MLAAEWHFFFLGKLARLGLESLVVSSDAVSGLEGSFFFFFFFFLFVFLGGGGVNVAANKK